MELPYNIVLWEIKKILIYRDLLYTITYTFIFYIVFKKKTSNIITIYISNLFDLFFNLN